MLVVLTGDCSVGKTRALWEAIHAFALDWRLLTPIDAVELNGLLDAGELTPVHGAVAERNATASGR